MKENPVVSIEERSARRIRAGYPWIFRSEIISKPAAEDGQIVTISEKSGSFVAQGFFNSQPQLSVRILTRDPKEQIDAGLFERRVERAIKYREALIGEPYYRIIHAESDGFPGLIVDRYGDVIVAQVNTAGMEKQFPHVQAALIKMLKPSAIVLRNESSSREQEGLPLETQVVYGKLDSNKVKIIENGVSFIVDVIEGQKTGWFFDQRFNRADVARLAEGRTMADIFCHTGGFGVTAAVKGATKVTFIDTSAKALADARENASANGVEKKCDYIEGRAFDVMEKLAGEGKKFGLVAVDPPAFIKSRKDLNVGMKAYLKLARLSSQLTEKGGYLFFASCSHHADLKDLAEHVAEGIAKTGRPFQLIRTAGAGADHPVHPFLPETAYLKALTYRFLD